MWDKHAKQAHLAHLAGGEDDKIDRFTNFTKLFIVKLLTIPFLINKKIRKVDELFVYKFKRFYKKINLPTCKIIYLQIVCKL